MTVKIPKLFPSFLKHRSAHKKINDSLMLHHDLIMCIIFFGGVKGETVTCQSPVLCTYMYPPSPSPHQNVPRDSEGRNWGTEGGGRKRTDDYREENWATSDMRDEKIRQKFCSTIESCQSQRKLLGCFLYMFFGVQSAM